MSANVTLLTIFKSIQPKKDADTTKLSIEFFIKSGSYTQILNANSLLLNAKFTQFAVVLTVINTATVINTFSPSRVPIVSPSFKPSASPTVLPVAIPSLLPISSPSQKPLKVPTIISSDSPTKRPSLVSTQIPSVVKTNKPSDTPTVKPLYVPTRRPSNVLTISPSKINSKTFGFPISDTNCCPVKGTNQYSNS